MAEIVLEKIISGGQTGADQAGLAAAEELGLETGGFMPAGGKTQDGYRPDLIFKYKMQQTLLESYTPRTQLNVQLSDGTIRIASDFQSRGEQATLKFIRKHNKPYLDVDRNAPLSREIVRKWLSDNHIVTLNIAGNSEQRSPGMFQFAKNYLIVVLRRGLDW